MTDLERLELIIRRVVADLRNKPWDTGWDVALLMIADELAAKSVVHDKAEDTQ